MTFGVCEKKNPLNFPKTSPCVLDEYGNILKGVCSEETEEKLKLTKECHYVLLRQRFFIQVTLAFYLLLNMCTYGTTSRIWDNGTRNHNITTRIPPYLQVDELQDEILISYIPYGKQEIELCFFSLIRNINDLMILLSFHEIVILKNLAY